MNIDEIKIKLEALNIELKPADRDEIARALATMQSDQPSDFSSASVVTALEQKLYQETDWRKRAQLAAQIISLKLSTDGY